jgi:hypothetical protein
VIGGRRGRSAAALAVADILRYGCANIHMQKELRLVKLHLDIPAYADLSLVKDAANDISSRPTKSPII